MKLLSVQSFSLFRNGGGSRVLRRLYQDKEKEISSIALQDTYTTINAGNIDERLIYIYPKLERWMRWKLRIWNMWLQRNTFYNINIKRITKKTQIKDYDIIHIVSHGPFVSVFNKDIFTKDKQLWVSFHDHYSTTDVGFENTLKFWTNANRRLVISTELGCEYQKLFGEKKFELITDGVSEEEVSIPKEIDVNRIIIYFAGLLHIEYLPLLKTLSDTLELLYEEGISSTLILRGTQEIGFLENRLFQVEYRNNYISDEDIKLEIDSASILYLPIKFSDPNFYLYSLSTKMVSYLGGAGAILYHGPGNSAAHNLLHKNEAAACCNSLETKDLSIAIQNLLTNASSISLNAKKLAREEFNMKKIQDIFWENNA